MKKANKLLSLILAATMMLSIAPAGVIKAFAIEDSGIVKTMEQVITVKPRPVIIEEEGTCAPVSVPFSASSQSQGCVTILDERVPLGLSPLKTADKPEEFNSSAYAMALAILMAGFAHIVAVKKEENE